MLLQLAAEKHAEKTIKKVAGPDKLPIAKEGISSALDETIAEFRKDGKIKAKTFLGVKSELMKNRKLRKEFMEALGEKIEAKTGLSADKFGGKAKLGKIGFNLVSREKSGLGGLSPDIAKLVAENKEALGSALDHVMHVTGETNILHFFQKYKTDSKFREIVNSELSEVKSSLPEGFHKLSNEQILFAAGKARVMDMSFKDKLKVGLPSAMKQSLIHTAKFLGAATLNVLDRMTYLVTMGIV